MFVFPIFNIFHNFYKKKIYYQAKPHFIVFHSEEFQRRIFNFFIKLFIAHLTN